MTKRMLAGLAVLGLGMLAVLQARAADSKPQQDHPRRTEVNDRLKNQSKRVKNGNLNNKQKAQIHKEDARIRRENGVSRRIKRGEHRDAKGGTPGGAPAPAPDPAPAPSGN